MRKQIVWLNVIVLFGLILSACGTQNPQLEWTPAPSNTPAAATEAATNTPELVVEQPTATPLPEDTATPEPTLPPTDTPEPSATPTEALGIGSERTFGKDNAVQVYVPAGEFTMGAADNDPDAKREIAGGRAYPEIPANQVYLDNFWYDKYEVTNGRYKLCVEAGACKPPYLNASETRPSYFDNPEFADYPVIWVSWFMAKDFCTWAGRRLPTEAEWEKTARGPDALMYPWGNEPLDGTRANFCDKNCKRTIANPNYDDGYADTAPVGSYPAGASPYGAMDMVGNVWEWTGTLIRDFPYDPNDGRDDVNLTGERAWRGGPWSNGTWWMRASLRYRSIPTYWNVNLGFRCASTP